MVINNLARHSVNLFLHNETKKEKMFKKLKIQEEIEKNK